MTLRKTPLPTRIEDTQRRSQSWDGIEWSGGSQPAVIRRNVRTNDVAEFGIFVAGGHGFPVFVGVDLDDIQLVPHRIVALMDEFRKAFNQTLSLAAGPDAKNRGSKNQPPWFVFGTNLAPDAAGLLVRAGAFVVDRGLPQGREFGTIKAITGLFQPLEEPYFPPAPSSQQLSKEELAEVMSYPPGVKPGDLQRELDEALRNRQDGKTAPR